MNNRFLFVNTRQEKKIYERIMEYIEQKRYSDLFTADHNDGRFGLTKQKYIDSILERIEREVYSNPDIVLEMHRLLYHRAGYYTEMLIRDQPQIVERFIEEKIWHAEELIPLAMQYGYTPTDDYINDHMSLFYNVPIMSILFDRGYRPTDEIIERYMGLFSNEELFTRILDWGFVPSLEFLKRTPVLKNPKFVDKILDRMELTPEIINNPIFSGNALAQRYIIAKRPDFLSKLNSGSTSEAFWIEAFKQGYIPKDILNDYFITHNYLLFTKLIKYKPDLIKYCKIYDENLRDKADELAICMGYVPTLSDVQSSDYVKTSPKLMKTIILRRPEAIKYVAWITAEGLHPVGQMNKRFSEFTDLCRLALDTGYNPTEEDVIQYPVLTNSYEIMKILIERNPDFIKVIHEYTPHKEELLKLAIANGFKGDIQIGSRNGAGFMYREPDALLATETAIMYQIERGKGFDTSIPYGNQYSINLYHFLINKCFKIEDIIQYFVGNFEAMKEIIAEYPEYITMVDIELSRQQIDELGLLAMEKGYVPKFEDEIFGYGSETAKVMVKLYPNYLEKVHLMDHVGFLSCAPCAAYDEICKLSADAGFLPDVEKMGNGYGGMTTIVYNYSYDIMKKAIPLKPELIESCNIPNKAQFDELCQLAISCGYEPDSEYALTHWAERLCSNYDMMAIYLKKNPRFILRIAKTNQEEVLKLLDIAIQSGLEIENLSQRDLLRLFLPIDEEKLSDYLSPEKIESIHKAKALHKNNDQISETILPNFLSESITSHFTPAQIEILSCYPQLQEKIINISSTSQKAKIIYELVERYKDNLEWIPILEKALNNINSSEYINLLASIEGKELSEEDKETLLHLIMTNNHLDISTLEELQNIDSIRENYIKMLIERNTLGSLKTAYFEKVFGIDLQTALNLVNLYGKSLESTYVESLDEESKSILIILQNMKKIINLDNIEILKHYIDNVNPSFIVKPDLMITYESKLKQLFTKEFNRSLAKPIEEDKVTTDVDGEKDLDIYLAAGQDGTKKFRLMFTSLGAYTNMDEPDDYYASWNIDKIAAHGCCCSYIGEKNLGTARVKYCCLGFTDYEPGSLHLAAPYDLCSTSSKDSYQISAMYSSMFLLPDDMLDYTRHTHNEVVWERRNPSGQPTFKKQPSYIVFFVDNFEDRLTNPEAMKQWESVKKAAIDFGIDVDGIKKPLPIMVVEREKIAKSQHDIIQTELREFKETHNPGLIKKIISDYESNYAGNRDYHPNISEKYFPMHEKLSESVTGQIIEIIKELQKTNPDLARECIYELEKVIRCEQEKYNNTQHGVSQTVPSFDIGGAMNEINELKQGLKKASDSTLDLIQVCEPNLKQFQKVDVLNMDPELLGSQLSAAEVETLLTDSDLTSKIVQYENEIRDEKVNATLKVHGQRHIKNVLLYSALIGQEVIHNSHDLELVLLAAKYHDVGRETEGHEDHADPSAKIAVDRLKDKYPPEDLAIIRTIIQFHEAPRNSAYTEEYFIKIAKENGIPESQLERVRQMAEVLKDADALDRTRFINRARLNPKYLKFDISKKLVQFSASVQETYALQDLKDFHCDDQIDILLQHYTPQEVLRTIRHSTRAFFTVDDIQSFIRTWAASVQESELQDMLSDGSSNGNEDGVKNGKK